MLIDRLVEECSENFDENKLISVNLNNYKNVRGYWTIYILLSVIFFIELIRISCTSVYFYWYLMVYNANIININANTKTVVY